VKLPARPDRATCDRCGRLFGGHLLCLGNDGRWRCLGCDSDRDRGIVAPLVLTCPVAPTSK
jgi:hypothetical protein